MEREYQYRYAECPVFTSDNVKAVDMTVGMMLRYTWFGSIQPFNASFKVK